MSHDDKQHDHAHAIASALQEALEDYLDDLPEGEAVDPLAVYLGIQITNHGWFRFLSARGYSHQDLIGYTIQAVECSAKLMDYLNGTDDRFVPTPSAENLPLKFFVDGPTEEV